MSSRLRTILLVSLGVAGLLVVAPAALQAQRGWVARAAVNEYMSGPYDGYGGYGYQPRYYGSYGNAYPYGNGGYSYGTTGYGYQRAYPAFGYGNAYGYGYGGYPAYTYRRAYYSY